MDGRENDKTKLDRIVTYAVKEFEVAIREMLEQKQMFHSFRLTDGPPAWDVLIMLAPTEIVDLVERKMNADAAAFMASVEKLQGAN
jgi:hypothetical protein